MQSVHIAKSVVWHIQSTRELQYQSKSKMQVKVEHEIVFYSQEALRHFGLKIFSSEPWRS